MTVKPYRSDMLSAGPTDAEMESVGRHFAYWVQLAAEGVAFAVGRTQTTDPDTMGIAIFQAETEEVAQQIVAADPAVGDGVFKMELRPYFLAILGDPAPFAPPA